MPSYQALIDSIKQEFAKEELGLSEFEPNGSDILAYALFKTLGLDFKVDSKERKSQLGAAKVKPDCFFIDLKLNNEDIEKFIQTANSYFGDNIFLRQGETFDLNPGYKAIQADIKRFQDMVLPTLFQEIGALSNKEMLPLKKQNTNKEMVHEIIPQATAVPSPHPGFFSSSNTPNNQYAYIAKMIGRPLNDVLEGNALEDEVLKYFDHSLKAPENAKFSIQKGQVVISYYSSRFQKEDGSVAGNEASLEKVAQFYNSRFKGLNVQYGTAASSIYFDAATFMNKVLPAINAKQVPSVQAGYDSTSTALVRC